MFFVELLYEEICLEILVLVGIVFILVIRVSLFRLLVIDIGLEIFFNILVLFFSVIKGWFRIEFLFWRFLFCGFEL